MAWGYLLILLGSILFCAMTAVRKEYQIKADATLKSTLVFMLVSSLFVCVIGLIYSVATGFTLVTNADGFVLGLGLLFAFILTVNTCLCIFGAKYGSLAIVTMFATLGTLVISTLYGLIVNPTQNKLSVFNVVGISFAVIIIALSFIEERNKPKTESKENKNQKAFIAICLAVFLFNGSALSVYSLFTSNRAEYGGLNFIFLYSFFSVLLCLIALLIILLSDRKKNQPCGLTKCVKPKPLICTLIYGALFIGSEFFSLTTTTILPIVIQAPLTFAINVIIVAIADYLIYKQKLTKIQLIQIALAIVSGICFAI